MIPKLLYTVYKKNRPLFQETAFLVPAKTEP